MDRQPGGTAQGWSDRMGRVGPHRLGSVIEIKITVVIEIEDYYR